MKNKYFVTAIGTGVGKTITSAVLCQALKADYWKPVQAGGLDNSDSRVVGNLISDPDIKVHFERYRLETPCSPHLAASLDNVKIEIDDFSLPQTENNLIVEGAGGLLVPLNDRHTVLDLISHLKIPVILVSKNYLGSINHTLLSISKLQQEKIDLKGVIFNGEKSKETERIIREMTGVKYLTRINQFEKLDKNSVAEEALRVKQELYEQGIE